MQLLKESTLDMFAEFIEQFKIVPSEEETIFYSKLRALWSEWSGEEPQDVNINTLTTALVNKGAERTVNKRLNVLTNRKENFLRKLVYISEEVEDVDIEAAMEEYEELYTSESYLND